MKINIIPPKEEPRFESVLARYNFTEQERRDMWLHPIQGRNVAWQ